MGGWRAQRNRRNALETPVELVARNTVAPRNSLNLLAEQLNVCLLYTSLAAAASRLAEAARRMQQSTGSFRC